MSDLFIGSTLATINARGELALPDDFCITIQSRRARDALFVALDDEARSLVVSDLTGVSARVVPPDRDAGAGDGRSALRRTFGFAASARMDGRGRIAIAPWVLPRCGRRRRALLVGMGQYFEIWDLDDLLDHGPADLRLLANRHLDAIAKKEEDSHDASVQPVQPRRRARRTGKPGIPVQPLPAVPSRSDPLRGVPGG